MPIDIHGKKYYTVAERVAEAHGKFGDKLSITTELVSVAPVVFKATVLTGKGTFTGFSAADPLKPIEKASPYEVAESSAVGRALGFAGCGSVESIASAEEMIVATTPTRVAKPISRAEYEAVADYRAGEICRKCGSRELVEQESRSAANNGRMYLKCNNCKSFSHWADDKTAPQIIDKLIDDTIQEEPPEEPDVDFLNAMDRENN